MLFSEWATRRTHQGKPLKMSFIDVRKAYFYGTPSRNLFIRPPAEMGLPKGLVARLERCMYGCRDSGSIWEAVYTDALKALGFTQGVASPCCFYHRELAISVVVHGDDFTALGTDDALDYLEAGMQEHFEIKLKGRIGHGDNDCKQMRVLNRILTVCPEGLLYEPDPRHVEMLARAFNYNFEDTKPSLTPGTEPKYEEDPQPGQGENLEDIVASIRAIRSQCYRISFPEEIEYLPAGCSLIPRDHLLDGPIGSLASNKIGEGCDVFTGVPRAELIQLKQKRVSPTVARRRILARTLREGA